jgi:hypothetical protein
MGHTIAQIAAGIIGLLILREIAIVIVGRFRGK